MVPVNDKHNQMQCAETSIW